MRTLLAPKRRRVVAAVAACAVVGAAALAIPAGSNAASDPVTPSSGFQGEVNFSSVSGAAIVVVCPSELQTTGAVKAGQYVNIFHDVTTGGPRTGLSDTRVVEHFEGFDSETITITQFGQQNAIEIPTTFHAPCSGSGHAIFQPGPGGGGTPDVVDLVFVKVASG